MGDYTVWHAQSVQVVSLLCELSRIQSKNATSYLLQAEVQVTFCQEDLGFLISATLRIGMDIISASIQSHVRLTTLTRHARVCLMFNVGQTAIDKLGGRS